MATDSGEERQYSSIGHLRRRAVVGVLRAWREVESTARSVAGVQLRPDLPREEFSVLREQMRNCVAARGGELTARAHTAELGRTYLELNAQGRARFLRILASGFDIDRARLDAAIAQYKKSGQEAELREALVSQRSLILRRFTALPDGFKFLVDMRADLIPLAQKDAKLKGLEADMKAIFSSWFDIGLLDLVEITWQSPAALLEKLMEYEAVHRIKSWEDLKNRLDADRRVYAFFHNKMPLEPLIFVQVAFVEGMSDTVQALLDTESPVTDIGRADTAIFYSISNAQKGLAGISFGNFLIKRVVAELTKELKHIKTFATLSPIPGFRAWLDPMLAQGEASLLESSEQRAVHALRPGNNPACSLHALLATDWHRQKKTAAALEPILMRLCAHYLFEEKKGGGALDTVARDTVARDTVARDTVARDTVASFHLFNGARLERINWLADTSPNGMRQSYGMMANYHYKLSEIDGNHEEYVAQGKIVASRQVRGYL